MTPLQKSIAEIEANIAEIRKKNRGVSSDEIQRTELLIAGLCSAKSTITANLEYERGVIVQAWTDGTYGIGDNAHDYYTKTYEQ